MLDMAPRYLAPRMHWIWMPTISHIQVHHQRWDADSLVRNHVEALASALGHIPGDERMRVFFCALQPSNSDLTRVSALLARSYDVRGIFLVRDPRAHLASKLVRNPTLSLRRFCRRQNHYWQEIEDFAANVGPVMRLRFEDLVTRHRAADARGLRFCRY